jgi:hypothetical protein
MANPKHWLATRKAPMDQQEMHQATWAEVDEAAQRQQSRVRQKVCLRHGVEAVEAMAPRGMSAVAQLVRDSPEQRAQDEVTLHRWRQQQGIPPDNGDVRQRIAQNFEAMTRRLGAEGSR